MALAVPATFSAGAGAGATLAVPVSGISAGDLLVVITYMFSSSSLVINAPTDGSNTYTQRSGTAWAAGFRSIAKIADTIVVTPPTTVTAHASGAGATLAAVVLQVTGAASTPLRC